MFADFSTANNYTHTMTQQHSMIQDDRQKRLLTTIYCINALQNETKVISNVHVALS